MIQPICMKWDMLYLFVYKKPRSSIPILITLLSKDQYYTTVDVNHTETVIQIWYLSCAT